MCTFVVNVEVFDGAPVSPKIFEGRMDGGRQHLANRTKETTHHLV